MTAINNVLSVVCMIAVLVATVKGRIDWATLLLGWAIMNKLLSMEATNDQT